MLEDFFEVYSRSMHRLGSPPQPKSFFRNLLTSEKGCKPKIFCVYLNNSPIAVSFTLSHNTVIESCWAGSLSEYNKYYAMYLLYWTMIEYSIKNNFKLFSFGRSNKESGTLRFKKHWKSETLQLYYNRFGPSVLSLRKMNFTATILKKIPYNMNLLLGKIFTKYLY